MDAIPVISQLKSLVQAIFLDLDGAEQTQQKFSRQCPVVSQIRSAVEASCGDCDAASQTQMEQLKWLSGLVNGVPVVGHIKGGIHFACGDFAGGDEAIKSSSRMSAVIGGAIIGGIAGGPGGGIAGAVAGGAAADGTITAIDSACEGEFRGHGTIGAIQAACEAKGGKKAGHSFDVIFSVAGDAVTGFVIGAKIKGSTYAKKPVAKVKDPRYNFQSKLVRCTKKGAAPVYAHDNAVNLGIIDQSLPKIAKANPGKPVHVAAGMHGAPLQHCFTADMAPKNMRAGLAHPVCYKTPKIELWGAAQKGPPPNYVLYDMAKAAHKAQFKVAMQNPSNVCYIQWCYGTQNPALNATPGVMAKAAAFGTAIAAITDAGHEENEGSSSSSSSFFTRHV